VSRRHWDLPLLLGLSLLTRLVAAALIPRPGYMDTAYYAAGAVRLAQGGGLSEPFIWNYLDDPAGLPHPGFLYWMPLPSLLAAPFAALLPGSFLALQFPFALLSALLPPIAYGLALGATDRRCTAWLAGLLTLFSGFFFPYWTLPETFAPFALFGALALWLGGRRGLGGGGWLLVGALVGLAHLTRADGLLLLPVVALALLLFPSPRGARRAPRIMFHVSYLALGYLLVMGPWLARNLAVVGAPLPSAGARTLWLRAYDDLFCYRCDLSLRSYLAWGWSGILRSKLWAMGVNLQRFLAEDCLVGLFPFTLVGLYRLRRRPAFTLSIVYLLLLYLVHSLAFTFPGPRGGFFHASAALLPFLHTSAAEGLDAAVGWAARRRRWNGRQARLVFTLAALALAVLLSLSIGRGKWTAWRTADAVYDRIGRWLAWRGEAGATVMVVNPPAFWYHTRNPCVVIPNGDAEVMLEVAARYGVDYLVLEPDHPRGLAPLYARRAAPDRLSLVAVFGSGRVTVWSVRR